MILVNASDGILNIQAEVKIPSAPVGHWSPERHARLAELISDYVSAAELVDNAERENRRYVTAKTQTRGE